MVLPLFLADTLDHVIDDGALVPELGRPVVALGVVCLVRFQPALVVGTIWLDEVA